MEAGKEGDGGKDRPENLAAVWREKMQREWQKIREHAETYPYVWASYAAVYGCFGVYLTYRWQKLRRSEGRVRVLQERLRKLAEDEDAAASNVGGVASEKPPPAKSVPTLTKVDEKLS